MSQFTVPDIEHLPDLQRTATKGIAKTQLATSNNVAYLMDMLGITPRFNMLTGLVELERQGFDTTPQQQLETWMYFDDTLQRLYIAGMGQAREAAQILGKQNPYHPMEDYLTGLVWDGTSRIEALIASVKTDNLLWPVYLENWLVQVAQGVCGWRGQDTASLPYVLTLVGAQGCGKSRWLYKLGAGWMLGEAELHLSTSSGKDHQIEVLSHAMAELAELDGIFRKADISHMKAFISRDTDAIRTPYARTTTVRPRMTTFCASVNEAEFLNDPTGSRRFWPVNVLDIDWDFEMDWDQLWAEVYLLWQDDPGFDLTGEEDKERVRIALHEHTHISDEESDLREYYRLHWGNKKYEEIPMNRSQILKMIFGENRRFDNKTTALMGTVISDLLSDKHRTIDGLQRAWRFPYNALAHDRRSWPDKISLRPAE